MAILKKKEQNLHATYKVCMYIYTHTYTCICMYMYMYIYCICTGGCTISAELYAAHLYALNQTVSLSKVEVVESIW